MTGSYVCSGTFLNALRSKFIALSIPLSMSFSGYFSFNKNACSSYILIFSKCCPEITVLNLCARLKGISWFVCLGWLEENKRYCFLLIIDI